jgi:dihydroorotase
MTLYLTSETRVEDVREAKDSGLIHAIKLYPAGATTNSEFGITAMRDLWPVLEEMQRLGMPLLLHGEVTDPEVDIFDRERVFVERVLASIIHDFPSLRIVLEHVTSEEGVRFVQTAHNGVAATITPHHMLLTRNDILVGGIHPHHYCLPVVKTERDRRALVEAAISGSAKFFAGTDSAPHPRRAKESACGRAGIYSAHASVELYAEIFDRAGALNRLEGFTSEYGAGFYGLPQNIETIRLVRREWTVPESYPFDGDEIVPLFAGAAIGWSVV